MATALVTHSPNTWPIGNVQHWEETGARLENAITAYLHSCLALEQSTSKVPPIGIDNLHVRLDRRIEYFHTLMTHPLAQSLASVARTRNKLVTPIYRIPPEVLGRIFEFAFNGAGDIPHMKTAISKTWRTLHRILGVCSVWRQAALAHVPLWTLVPIVSLNNQSIITMKSANLSFERAGRSNLHFVMDTGSTVIPNIGETLAIHGPRIRSLFLCSSAVHILDYWLCEILKSVTPGSIAALSLCNEEGNQTGPMGPSYLFTRQDPAVQTAFEAILQKLRVLHLDNVIPRLGAASLRNLIDLRIQEVVFGPEAALEQFLRALTTLSQIETLDLISIGAYEVEASSTSTSNAPLSLSNLKTLFLEDLSCNTIRTVLSNIKPGDYRIVLSASNECLVARRGGIKVHSGFLDLHAAIQPHKIDTLMLTEIWYGTGLDPAGNLRSLLEILPTITTIYLNEQILDRASLIALTRRPDIPESELGLPKLRQVYISCSNIDDIGDQTAFKQMLSSHPLEELVLGGNFSEVLDIVEPGNSRNGDLEQVDIAGPDVRTISIRTWLQENIPKFKLLGRMENFKFKDSEWQLW